MPNQVALQEQNENKIKVMEATSVTVVVVATKVAMHRMGKMQVQLVGWGYSGSYIDSGHSGRDGGSSNNGQWG